MLLHCAETPGREDCPMAISVVSLMAMEPDRK